MLPACINWVLFLWLTYANLFVQLLKHDRWKLYARLHIMSDVIIKTHKTSRSKTSTLLKTLHHLICYVKYICVINIKLHCCKELTTVLIECKAWLWKPLFPTAAKQAFEIWSSCGEFEYCFLHVLTFLCIFMMIGACFSRWFVLFSAVTQTRRYCCMFLLLLNTICILLLTFDAICCHTCNNML
jgi:hypothetical protein